MLDTAASPALCLVSQTNSFRLVGPPPRPPWPLPRIEAFPVAFLPESAHNRNTKDMASLHVLSFLPIAHGMARYTQRGQTDQPEGIAGFFFSFCLNALLLLLPVSSAHERIKLPTRRSKTHEGSFRLLAFSRHDEPDASVAADNVHLCVATTRRLPADSREPTFGISHYRPGQASRCVCSTNYFGICSSGDGQATCLLSMEGDARVHIVLGPRTPPTATIRFG